MLWYSAIHTPPSDQPAIFAEVARVLRPGGHVLLADVGLAEVQRLERPAQGSERDDQAVVLARASATWRPPPAYCVVPSEEVVQVSEVEVDEYLAAVPEPQRSTLDAVRATLADLLPEAEQGIAYGVPCFKVAGKGVAGFGFYKNHCTYFPMSGSITAELADDLTGFVTAKGSIRFPNDEPLSEALVAKLVEARQREIAAASRRR